MELLEENLLGSDTEEVCYETGLSLDTVLATQVTRPLAVASASVKSR